MKTEIERLWAKIKEIAKPFIDEHKKIKKQDDYTRKLAIEEIIARSSKRWLVTETPISEMHISPLSEFGRMLCLESRTRHYERIRKSEDFIRFALSCSATDTLMLLRKCKAIVCVDDRLRKNKKWYELGEGMVYRHPSGELVMSFTHDPAAYAMPKLLSAATWMLEEGELSQPLYIGWVQGNNFTYGVWKNAEEAPLLRRHPEMKKPPLKALSP